MVRLVGKIIKLIDDIINLILILGCIFAIAFVIFFINGIFPYITLSGSMEPKIQTGSICFVDMNVCYDEVEEGDIIAFETFTGSMVTHRVVSVTENGLETKGDANNVSDGVSVTQDNFHGKTLFSIPYVGYILNFFKQCCKKVIALLALSFIKGIEAVEDKKILLLLEQFHGIVMENCCEKQLLKIRIPLPQVHFIQSL